MESCFKCGVSEEKALLYDTITPEGIQKICRKCSFHEESPIMKNCDALEIKDFERKQDIYERISKVSGIDHRKKLNQKNLALEMQDSSLRDLVEKNVCKGLNKNAKPREDLIKNFHWLIKRYRRLKHLTTKQFAEALREPEKLVLLAEQGIVPEGYDFIKKVEKFLGIALIKEEVYLDLKKKEEKKLEFDRSVGSELTISDLKEMKEKRKGGFFGWFSSKENEVSEEGMIDTEKIPEKNQVDKKDLNSKEVEDLIFGRK